MQVRKFQTFEVKNTKRKFALKSSGELVDKNLAIGTKKLRKPSNARKPQDSKLKMSRIHQKDFKLVGSNSKKTEKQVRCLFILRHERGTLATRDGTGRP